MALTDTTKVRTLTGLTDDDISNTVIDQCITWSDVFIGENYDKLVSAVQELASTQLSSHYAMQRKLNTYPNYTLSQNNARSPGALTHTRFYDDFLETVRPSRGFGFAKVND